jgi:hypothetical protein
MKNGIYIYGIIKMSEPQEFGEIGIGSEPSHVHTIGYKDIAAVVSKSPLTAYTSEAKEKVIKDLITHQFVIEKVMSNFTIVPVKFGTQVETTDDAVSFLEKGYDLLNDELCKTKQKIELDVVASWDVQKVLTSVYHQDPQIQKQQQDLAQQGTVARIEDKIKLGKLIEQTLQSEKARYSDLILQTLQAGAVDVCLHELAGDEMIFNAAFLLEKRHEEQFTTIVNNLNQQLKNAVNFRIIGPLPVYSFSTILLEKLDTQKLEEAKKVLALHEEITDKTVRDAYHQLAQEYHPDTRRNKDATQFPHINAAYRTLKNFVANGLMRIEVYRWEKDFKPINPG